MRDSQLNRACPICQSNSFDQTDISFDLAEILKRWEFQIPMTFRESVWVEYTKPSPQKVNLYRCNNCNFAMFLPAVTGSEGFYKDITVNVPYSPEKWEFNKSVNIIQAFRGKRVLDIGCGDGNFLDLLVRQDKSLSVIGYEFNPDVAEISRSKGHVVHSGEFSSAFHDTAPFDVVCMFQVIEHLSDPASIIHQVRDILVPNGILIIAVPDANGPIRHFSTALTDIPPHHVSRWSKSVFIKGMPKFGFRVLDIKYEPLPFYLWKFYLPVMLDKGDLLWHPFGRLLNQMHITDIAIKILNLLGIKWLHGVRGHTLLAVLQKE